MTARREGTGTAPRRAPAAVAALSLLLAWPCAAEPSPPPVSPIPPAAPATLSVADAVARARAVHPDLRALRARLDQQAASVRIALARVLPVLSLTGTYLRHEQQVQIAGRVVVAQDELGLTGGLDVGLWRPAALGGWLAERAVLDAERLAALYDADGVAAAVIELCVGIERARARQGAAERAQDRRLAFADAARARLERGLTDRSEVQRAELSLAEARMALDEAAADARAAQIALLAVLELPGQAVSIAGGTSPPAPQPTITPTRADLRAARLLLDDRDAIAETFAWLRFLPDIDLAGGFALEAASLSNPDGLTWQIQLRATWLLYDGGERYGVLDLEEATRDLHRAELDGLEATRRREAETAAVRVDQLDRQLATARASLDVARQYRADVERRLAAGLATLLDVLDAEAQLSTAEVLVDTLAADLDLARWRLLHARGALSEVLP